MSIARPSMIAGAAALGGAMPALARGPFRTEIIVRTINNLRGPADAESLTALAAQHGVGTINLAAKQDEDDEIASRLFYPSALAPRAPGYEAFDALAETIRAAHAHGLRVRARVPQFHDQMAIRRHPARQMQSFDGQHSVPYAGRDRREFFVDPVEPAARDYGRDAARWAAEPNIAPGQYRILAPDRIAGNQNTSGVNHRRWLRLWYAYRFALAIGFQGWQQSTVAGVRTLPFGDRRTPERSSAEQLSRYLPI